MDNVLVETHHDLFLASRAGAIRALGKRMVRDIIEIGRLLVECKEHVGRGNWLPWLDAEFGWTEMTAVRFMQVHELNAKKSNKLLDLSIDASALYALASPSTPTELRNEVIDRAANGEAMTHAQVKQMIDEARKKQDAEHKSDLDRKAESYERKVEGYERKITALQEKAEKQIADMRAQLELSLTPDKVEQAIEDALVPLKKKIAKYEQAIENQKTRVPIDHAGPASAIKGALRHLTGSLVITPEQFTQSQKQIAKLTQQQFALMIADDLANAKTVLAWLRALIKELEV